MAKEVKEKELSFKKLLEAGEIKVGDVIKFTSSREKTFVADQAFLNLPLEDEDFYKQYKYEKV
jgi:hypothetical protein